MLELFDNGIVYKNEVFSSLDAINFSKHEEISITDFCSDLYFHPIQLDITAAHKRNLIFEKTLNAYNLNLKNYHWEIYQHEKMDRCQYILLLIPKKRLNHLLNAIKKNKLKVKKHEPYLITVLNSQFRQGFEGIILVDEGAVLRAVYIESAKIDYYRVIPHFNFSAIDKSILAKFPWEKEKVFFGLYPQRLKRIEAWIKREFT